MKLISHRAARLALAAVTSAVALTSAWAQTTTDYRYSHLSRFKEDARYESSGVMIYPREAYPAKIYDVRPHQQLKQVFPGALVADGNNKASSDGLWKALLNSGYAMGSATRLTRAQDISEDWDINFVAPLTPDRNHWFDWYGDNYAAGTYVSYGKLMLDGPQKGARLMGNENVLAMGDDRSMWLDADGTLSFYWRGTGRLDFDSKRVNFPNGPKGWAGTPLRSHVAQLIGYEEGRVYFLEGDRLLHVFDRDLNFVRSDELYLSGELLDVSLGEVIDGKVPGVTYLGWDLGPVIGFFPR